MQNPTVKGMDKGAIKHWGHECDPPQSFSVQPCLVQVSAPASLDRSRASLQDLVQVLPSHPPWYVESSQIRDGTYVSCIGRQLLYHWATREAWFLFIISIQYYTGESSQENETRKGNKRHPDWTRRSETTSIWRQNKLKILRNPPKIQPINEFSKEEGYNTGLQK